MSDSCAISDVVASRANFVATSDLKMDLFALYGLLIEFVIHLKRQCVAPVSRMGGKMQTSSGHSV